MNKKMNRKQRELWLQQLKSGTPDEELTEALIQDFGSGQMKQFEQLLTEVSEIDEEAEVDSMVEACLLDEITVATTYPKFDLSFLPGMPKFVWPIEQLDQALAEYKSWLKDASETVYLLLGGILNNQMKLAPRAIKAHPKQERLLQYTLAEKSTGHEIAVVVFADDETNCTIEVGVYQPGSLTADLEGLPVALRYRGEAVVDTLVTDSDGIVQFEQVSRARLADVMIGVAAD